MKFPPHISSKKMRTIVIKQESQTLPSCSTNFQNDRPSLFKTNTYFEYTTPPILITDYVWYGMVHTLISYSNKYKRAPFDWLVFFLFCSRAPFGWLVFFLFLPLLVIELALIRRLILKYSPNKNKTPSFFSDSTYGWKG